MILSVGDDERSVCFCLGFGVLGVFFFGGRADDTTDVWTICCSIMGYLALVV